MATQVRTPEEIFKKIEEVLVEAHFLEGEAKMDTSFEKDLDLDSLDRAELVMGLEDEFGIRISDEDAAKLTTVGAAVDYIFRRQGSG